MSFRSGLSRPPFFESRLPPEGMLSAGLADLLAALSICPTVSASGSFADSVIAYHTDFKDDSGVNMPMVVTNDPLVCSPVVSWQPFASAAKARLACLYSPPLSPRQQSL